MPRSAAIDSTRPETFALNVARSCAPNEPVAYTVSSVSRRCTFATRTFFVSNRGGPFREPSCFCSLLQPPTTQHPTSKIAHFQIFVDSIPFVRTPPYHCSPNSDETFPQWFQRIFLAFLSDCNHVSHQIIQLLRRNLFIAEPRHRPQAQTHLRSEEHTSELQSRLHLVC